MNSIEKNIFEFIEANYQEATPGLKLQCYLHGKKTIDLECGKTFRFYDLASLTKVILSVSSAMVAFQDNRISFEQKINTILPWWPSSKTTVTDLLTHQSGLIWWYPFYEQVSSVTGVNQRWEELHRFLRNQKLEKTQKSVYSDIGFLLFGLVLERIFERPLWSFKDLLVEKWGFGETLHFNRVMDFNQGVESRAQLTYSESQYAPTEFCKLRNRVLRGEVHDENCWSLGGYTSHAGLFGTIDDLLGVGLQWRAAFFGQHKNIQQKICQSFFKRAIPHDQGDWAYGFMLPSKGGSSSGQYLAPSSIGHTGFTGTSIWFDPSKDLLIGILSNRVHLGRENKKFVTLRPQIHDKVVESLVQFGKL